MSETVKRWNFFSAISSINATEDALELYHKKSM